MIVIQYALDFLFELTVLCLMVHLTLFLDAPPGSGESSASLEESAEGEVSKLKVAELRSVLWTASGENGAVGRNVPQNVEEEVSCGGEKLMLWRNSEVKLAAEFQRKKGLNSEYIITWTFKSIRSFIKLLKRATENGTHVCSIKVLYSTPIVGK